MLAIAYHLGAGTATAQAPSNTVVAGDGLGFAFTANGDVYRHTDASYSTWYRAGNIFSAGPTPVRQESWGQLKARYRNTPGTAQPGTQDR